MGNIRKFLKYAIPIIALPYFVNNLSSIHNIAFAQLGTSVLAAWTALSTLIQEMNGLVYYIAIAVASICAILAERGKVKPAKTLHLIGLLQCVFFLLLFALIFVVSPQSVMKYYQIYDDAAVSFGVSYARLLGISVLVSCIVAMLIAQLSGKHSFVLQMVLGGGMTTVTTLTVRIVRTMNLGTAPLAIVDGLCYALGGFAPFLMLPVKTYSADLAPAPQKKKKA